MRPTESLTWSRPLFTWTAHEASRSHETVQGCGRIAMETVTDRTDDDRNNNFLYSKHCGRETHADRKNAVFFISTIRLKDGKKTDVR